MTMAIRSASRLIAAADLYGDLEPSPEVRWRDHMPGLAVTFAATLAAGYLSDHYGAPLTLMALLIGLSLNFLSADRRLAPGLLLASRTFLRWGIVLVGLRVTLGQIANFGPPALLAVIVIVAATLATGVLVSRWLGFSPAFGILAGGSVAICGASAAMAFASLLGERRINQAQLALTLVGISALSAFAMFSYPIIAHHLGFSDKQAGFLMGAAIHDVAQSLGAGYSFSQAAGDTAAVVKLSRVALLARAMAIVALFFPRDAGAEGRMTALPWFVVGFFAMAAANSVGFVPTQVGVYSQKLAAAGLACAVTATGMRSPMQSLLSSGSRPLLVLTFSTLVALLLATVAAALFLR